MTSIVTMQPINYTMWEVEQCILIFIEHNYASVCEIISYITEMFCTQTTKMQQRMLFHDLYLYYINLNKMEPIN